MRIHPHTHFRDKTSPQKAYSLWVHSNCLFSLLASLSHVLRPVFSSTQRRTRGRDARFDFWVRRGDEDASQSYLHGAAEPTGGDLAPVPGEAGVVDGSALWLHHQTTHVLQPALISDEQKTRERIKPTEYISITQLYSQINST